MEIISKIDAKARGLTRYFTGLPCIYDHIAQRTVFSGNCISCKSIFTARRYAEGHLTPSMRKGTEYRRRQKEKKAGRPRPECCEICSDANKFLVYDHCHQKGHFRGWICSTCNTGLGMAKDSPEVLYKMIEYLEKDRQRSAQNS